MLVKCVNTLVLSQLCSRMRVVRDHAETLLTHLTIDILTVGLKIYSPFYQCMTLQTFNYYKPTKPFITCFACFGLNRQNRPS